jgi:hypothetical protein
MIGTISTTPAKSPSAYDTSIDGNPVARLPSSLRSIPVSRMLLNTAATNPTASNRGSALRATVPRPWRPMPRSTVA